MAQRQYRYFYFKNGDVVAQLRRVTDTNAALPEGGPDAFLASLLRQGNVAEAVIAAFLSSKRDERIGPYRAITYDHGSARGRVGALLGLPLDILAFRPDRILCGRQGYALIACLLTGRLLGVPVVFSAHNRLFGQASGRLARLREKLDGWLIRRCRAAVCHGPFLAEELKAIGLPPGCVQVFDSGCGELMAAREATPKVSVHEPGTRRRILFIGRMIRDKGIFDLLEASLPLLAGGQAELVMLGEGADRQEMLARVNELGLQACVHVPGQVAHAEIGAEIARSWVVVTPTRRAFPEGRCMAAMEALALGVPLVAPDAGPFPFLVEHDVNGLLYPQDDAAALANCLRAVCSEPALRDRLARGAQAQSGKFRTVEVTFADAVGMAFAQAGQGRAS